MNDDQSTTQPPLQAPPPLEFENLASRNESEIIPTLLVHFLSRGIPVPQSRTPNLAELLEAVDRHLKAHQRRPCIEFTGGDKEWRSINNDLTTLYSSIKKILFRKISDRLSPKSELRSEQNTEAEELPGGHSSGHPTGQPPVTGRSPGGQSPNNPRSTPDHDANDNGFDAVDFDEDDLEYADEDDTEEIKKARAQYLAQLLRERTSRSPLDDLSPERQKTLFELLQEHQKSLVLEMISQPSPLGWGVKTSRQSLTRFYDRYREQHRKAELAEAADEAEKLIKDPAATPQNFAEATRRLIQLRLFQTAKNPHSSSENIEFLCRYLDRQRRTDLSERRLELAEQKITEKE